MATTPSTRIPSRPRTGPDHQLPPAGGTDDRAPGLSGLLRDLLTDTQTLFRQEIELARLETTRTAKRLAIDSAWIAAGVAVAAVGGLCLVFALALGLGSLLGSYWLGTLITGLLLLVIGGIVAWRGIGSLKREKLAPEHTVDSVREDAEWARQELREFKQELQGSER